MAIADGSFSFGNISNIIACAIGIIPPPPIPCKILDTSIIGMEVEIPQSIDATVKITRLSKKYCFLPINLQKKSTVGMTTPLATR